MALIYAYDASPRAGHVAEYRFDNLEPSVQALQTCGRCAAQIVDPPGRQAPASGLGNQPIEPSFRMPHVCERRAAVYGEYVAVYGDTGQLAQERERYRR